MAELKPFEVIMEISPIAGQNGKGELVFQVTKQTELVRCKDCKWHRDYYGVPDCELIGELAFAESNLPFTDDDFCSRGESTMGQLKQEGGVNE